MGFYSNIIENHDEPRGVSYYLPKDNLCLEGKKMLAVLYFFMRGLPFIYQGQEIGMENLGVLPLEQIDDISAIDQYQMCIDAGYTSEEALKIISSIIVTMPELLSSGTAQKMPDLQQAFHGLW